LSRRSLTAALTLLPLLTLGGCESLSKALGISRSVPDEFAIVTKAPLALPPDYALRPPQPGAPRPQDILPAAQAERALGGRAAAERALGGSYSTGEQALLGKSGGAVADPAIRQVVNSEVAGLSTKDRSFVDRLMFWEGRPAGQEPAKGVDIPVDAAKEAERLRRNDALGLPPTEGKTPQGKPEKKSGWFGGLFDWLPF